MPKFRPCTCKLPPAISRSVLISAHAKPHPCSEINSQRRVTRDFLIRAVQQILDVHVRRHPWMNGVPTPCIHQDVPRRMVHVIAEEVGVSSTPDEAPREIGAPTMAEITGEQRGRMFRTPNQRLSSRKNGIE